MGGAALPGKLIVRLVASLYHNCSLVPVLINPFSAKDVLIDFTLSNARRFYSSKGNPLALKGLTTWLLISSYNWI